MEVIQVCFAINLCFSYQSQTLGMISSELVHLHICAQFTLFQEKRKICSSKFHVDTLRNRLMVLQISTYDYSYRFRQYIK